MLTTYNIIWNLIDFLVLVFILFKLLSKPVGGAIANKKEGVSNHIDDI